mmetsp:Transcript_74388/g.198742  ORF Transcript_74388/g.198742 Transcript_74388/m.198742 type:complete len:205 (-) Transcript_74388:2507-3121(-)
MTKCNILAIPMNDMTDTDLTRLIHVTAGVEMIGAETLGIMSVMNGREEPIMKKKWNLVSETKEGKLIAIGGETTGMIAEMKKMSSGSEMTKMVTGERTTKMQIVAKKRKRGRNTGLERTTKTNVMTKIGVAVAVVPRIVRAKMIGMMIETRRKTSIVTKRRMNQKDQKTRAAIRMMFSWCPKTKRKPFESVGRPSLRNTKAKLG